MAPLAPVGGCEYKLDLLTSRSVLAALFFCATAAPLALAQSADLSVSKSGPAQAAAGSDVAYTITVFNLGPDDAPNATLFDTVPGGMTFVPWRTRGSRPPQASPGSVNAAGASA
jgi:uncharacterized repeat protein (TIGR01451 family)